MVELPRSVRAARARATLRRLHTQGLSRSPLTVPMNTEAADQHAGQRPVHTQRGVRNAHTWWRGLDLNQRPSGYETYSACLTRYPG